MKIYTNAEVRELTYMSHNAAEAGYDADGQLVIYCRIYRWSDGTSRDKPEDLHAVALALELALQRISLVPSGEIGPHDDPVWTVEMWEARNALRIALGLPPYE